MYKFSFYVPLSHAEQVKEAVFLAGGGRIGNYDCCSFEIEGIGQFRPLKGSNPFVGKMDEIEKVKELKVELVVANDKMREVLVAMKKAHPYEIPAYDIVGMEDFK